MENKKKPMTDACSLTDEQLEQVSGGGYCECKACGYRLSTYEDKTVCSMCGSQDIKHVLTGIHVFA